MRLFTAVVTTFCLMLGSAVVRADDAPATEPPPANEGGFTYKEIMGKAEGFFGSTTEGLAKAIEKVMKDYGQPNAYITGEEAGGAIGFGVRYGRGVLNLHNGFNRDVFWQGPSIGFDVGGNASKVFTLVYNLDSVEQLFQRYPGVEGTLYFVAGVGVNYLQSGNTVIAPIRTGVGWRQGANVGYLHFTPKKSWIPF